MLRTLEPIVLHGERASLRRRVSSRRCYGLVYIESEKLPQQLLQIIQMFGLRVVAERLFSRCSFCNMPVIDIDKKKVAGKVPVYVFETVENFSTCPSCHRIYWKGTHDELLSKQIREMGIHIEGRKSGKNTSVQ